MLLFGKNLADEIGKQLTNVLAAGSAKGLPKPKLAILLANDLRASEIYVKKKKVPTATLR